MTPKEAQHLKREYIAADSLELEHSFKMIAWMPSWPHALEEESLLIWSVTQDKVIKLMKSSSGIPVNNSLILPGAKESTIGL